MKCMYTCVFVSFNVCMLLGHASISNDGATIMKLLDVIHPAAKTLVEIAKSQDAEVRVAPRNLDFLMRCVIWKLSRIPTCVQMCIVRL